MSVRMPWYDDSRYVFFLQQGWSYGQGQQSKDTKHPPSTIKACTIDWLDRNQLVGWAYRRQRGQGIDHLAAEPNKQPGWSRGQRGATEPTFRPLRD